MKYCKSQITCIFLVLLSLISCSKDEEPENTTYPDVKVTSIAIVAENQSILKNSTTQLSTTIIPVNATNKTVVWSSSDETIASIDINGLVTGIAAGEVTVTAKSGENQTILATISLEIVGIETTTNDITSFIINGNTAAISDYTINFEFLEGTKVDKLTPTISHNGVSIFPANNTAQDFTEPVTYTVTAGDGTTQEWQVIIDFKPIPESDSKFITTWKTDNPGASEDNQITIPTFPGEFYNYSVDWGDGTSDTGVTGDIVHTYDSAGTYSIAITGIFPAIYFANPFNNKPGDDDKILSIDQWGTNQWRSMTDAFSGCDNLDMKAYDIPDFSHGLATNFMFAACPSLVGNTSMNFWDVSAVTNMNLMFQNATLFNQDISNWDVTSVDGLNGTFFGCTSFNQDISSWNVQNVENFGSVFYEAKSFNQDIGNWNVSKATSMNAMFLGASSFNQDIGNWNVENVTDMVAMFSDATSFDQNLENWNVGQVVYMGGIFERSGLSKENYDSLLIGWNDLPSLQRDVVLFASHINYCQSEAARQNIIDTYGWTINDAGKSCN